MAAEAETQDPQQAPPAEQQVNKNLILTLSDGAKVKRRLPRQRACNEPGEKGKICAGHLKRWYDFGGEVKQRFGPEAEVYRCEHCHTLYIPDEKEPPRTLIQRW